MIPQDKILHLLAGFFIATCFQFTGPYMILIAVIAGLLKELYDKYCKKTKFDVPDFICTSIGGLAAFWIYLVMLNI